MQEKNFDNLINECKRIQDNSLWNSTSHFAAATWAGRIHTIGGAVPIILGGIGGWKYLLDPTFAGQDQMFLAGLMSLIAGIVGSLMTYWNMAKVRLEHFSAATKYKTLENDARRAHQIHARDEDYDTFKKRVMDIVTRYDALGEASVQSYDITFWLARRKIESGIYDTSVDKTGRSTGDNE